MILIHIQEDEALTVLDSKGKFWSPDTQPIFIMGFGEDELNLLASSLMVCYWLTQKEELLAAVENVNKVIRELHDQEEVGKDISWDDASEQ